MYARLADLLTGSRIISSLLLIWLGTRGPDTLPVVTLLICVTWTTDQLDGWAARRATTATRLAHFDFPIDVSVYVGLLLYLALTGYVLPELVTGYVLIVAALTAATRHQAVVVLALRVVDAVSAWILIQYDWRLIAAVILWLLILAVVYRRRLKERVPLWLRELRGIARHAFHK